ncbi:MAG TPA: AAA family ATPase [Candidatus Acidoferrum sp.]|nr:AAA family ATPase [Candidatus Acidoferrum sp.]
MRMAKIGIKNFRSFRDVEVNLGPFTSLVGPNGGGKSTILCALNIFFRETENAATNLSELDAEDFHDRRTDEAIEITVTFCDLNPEAQKDFAEYYRQGVLTITAKAIFNPDTGVATVRQFGQRSAMDAFKDFFKLYNDGKKADELKAQYESIRSKFSELPKPSSKDAMRDALREYEESHPEQCTLIPSEDQFYGFSKGGNRLSRYVQWVYVPAVKDATKENIEAKNTALGKILARTVRAKVKFDEDIQKLRDETLTQYRKILDAQEGALSDISKALTGRLIHWAHPDATARLTWAEDARKVQVEEPVARLLAGEGSFEGELARFGHGLQRSYLLALLQELASSDDANAPRLILGCEEPELYQHPPQARHLSHVLQELCAANSQIIVSTHSPYFVSGQGFESVRMVRRDSAAKRSNISQVTFNRIAQRIAEVTGEAQSPIAAERARLQQALQPNLNEMFFTPKLILVEGIEDLAYITSWMILSDRWTDFRRHGCHVVPTNGKGYLIEPIIIAQALDIPVFVLFDADGNKTKASERDRHEIENRALLRLLGGNDSDPFPNAAVWGASYVQWPTNLGNVLKSEVDPTVWDQTFGEATKTLGNPEGSYIKNPVHIGDHVRLLKEEGHPPSSLDRLCAEIIRFAAA